MLNTRFLLRNNLIVCIAGIIGLAVSVAVAAEEGGFPLAFGTLGTVQSGSNVQSASGVIETLYRLALEEGYTDAEAEALIAAAGGLIDGDVPPGTLLHISRELLSDLDAAELLTTLEELEQLIAEGVPPGQAANEILERGNGNNGNGNSNDYNDDNGNGNGSSDDDDDDDDDDGNNNNGNGSNGNGSNGNGNNGGGNNNP